jgi:hypothetical protein
MKQIMFKFDPRQYAAQFTSEGYVHIPKGAADEFYGKMAKQADEYITTSTMKEFAIGDKQQAMYEFPNDADYVGELFDAVAGVTGLNRSAMVLSERHIKAYESTAEPEPHAHKDRFASEISVGISVHVQEGSTLVLYPYDDNGVNPFNTSVGLRASLSKEQYPEPALKKARRVEIKDAPGDVIMFRGHSIWHLRANPANTTMLYLKLNTFNCDPLGEDPATPGTRTRSQAAAAAPDEQLERMIPVIGRRVDYLHRHFNRNWEEVPGVVLWGEKHFSIDEFELSSLRAMDGKRTVASVIAAVDGRADKQVVLKKFRRLALRGVIDLLGPHA